MVCLFKLSFHVLLVCLVALANGEFVIGLMPLSVASDGIELAGVALVVIFVVFTSASLHDGMLGVPEVALCLHFLLLPFL